MCDWKEKTGLDKSDRKAKEWILDDVLGENGDGGEEIGSGRFFLVNLIKHLMCGNEIRECDA